LSRDDFEAGWLSLFDGETLFGWKANSDLNWRVEGGVIRADKGTPGLLLTTFELADYELRYDYRLEQNGNSGVFLRTVFNPKDPAVDCYELNMCDTHPDYSTGSLVAREKVQGEVGIKEGWRHFHVRVEGSHIIATLDGQQVIDFTDTSAAKRQSGFIGLQMNGGQIEFRNIFLKPLATEAVFNGKDLSGWKVVDGSKSKFEATDEKIHVTGGTGFLETEKTWGDFVLQTVAKTNVDAVNSGIFFRAMPGSKETPSNGYELQIHHGFADGDRTKPNDYGTGFGTGAIFRRMKVRRVVGNDKERFAMTLIANGPHFSTWVNGYQVVDWADKRKPHENPRKGQRLKAGHFSLQGHDPGTDLEFYEVRVAEIVASE